MVVFLKSRSRYEEAGVRREAISQSAEIVEDVSVHFFEEQNLNTFPRKIPRSLMNLKAGIGRKKILSRLLEQLYHV
ncbi:hypothetical protein TNCV_2856341 [Trichonephila clavipes]|nr:hypothetical protein TNCV_2856341 [Trichonephila clavipes]